VDLGRDLHGRPLTVAAHLTSHADAPVLPGVTPASACTDCGTVTPDDLLWVWGQAACCEACAVGHPVLARLMADDQF
jgi:hypothetical protein